MKLLKNLFYGLAVIIMLICAGILILAFSPDLTKTLSEKLYGENGLIAPIERLFSGDTQTPENGEISSGMMTNPEDEDSSYGVNTKIADGVLASDENLGYVAPVRGSINLPNQVTNKNGYQPVSGSGEELGEEQADALGSQLKTLATGDGLSFDPLFYPYYNMLNENMKHLYRQIYANALELNESFAPVEQVNTAQLKNVFEAVYNDHPELFWLETGYSCKYRSGGACVEVSLSYNRTAQNLAQAKEEFDAAAKTILDGAKRESDDGAKEKYVHDALLGKADYSLSAAMNQSAYSALVSGDTVCAGYSRAFQYLLQQLQIPCYYCTGYSGEDHAWNIVRTQDGYRNVDVTWDDTDPATYDFYNKTDADFVGTHVRTGLSVYLPPCGSREDQEETDVSGNNPSDNYLAGGEVVAGITLNPNPQQPLRWEEEEKGTASEGSFVSGGDLYDMTVAGLTDSMVQNTLKQYYANCLKQMTDRGTGQQAFSNVVPKYVLKQVEQAYGTGAYEKGYVEEGLKKLGVENFAIQIQVRDLGGNYYRLYHNISTW